MASSSSPSSPLLKLPLLFFFLFLLSTPIDSTRTPKQISNTNKHTNHKPRTSTFHSSTPNKSLCQSTPYPSACLSSMDLSVALNLPADIILSLVLKSLLSAISTTTSLSHLLDTASHSPYLVEKQRGSLEDCQELHAATLSSLSRTSSFIKSSSPDKFLPDIRTHLSAALTNKVTCLEGLAGSTGPMKNSLSSSLLSAYQPISNALSLVPKGPAGRAKRQGRRLSVSDLPAWVPRRDRRLLQSDDDDGDDDGDDNGDDNGDNNGGNDENGDGDNGY